METILDYLERNARQQDPDWYFPAEDLSLGLSELAAQAQSMAALLKQSGLSSGDRVALILPNSSAFVVTLLALWYVNAVAVPLRLKGSRQTNYADYVTHCDAVCDFSLIIHDKQFSPEVFGESALVQKQSYYIETLMQEITGQVPIDSAARIADEDVAILQFSSGSTGSPKAAIVTHAMMMAQLQNILYNHIGSRRGRPIESLASWMPVNHDMGLFIGVLTPIYCACRNMMAGPEYYMRNPPRWFRLMSERRVDMNFSTNSVLASTLKILRRLQQTDIDLSALHLYIGAEKVSPIIVRRCYEYLEPLGFNKRHLHIGYGMAENTLGAACSKTPLINIRRFHFIGPNRLAIAEHDNVAHAFEVVAVGHPDWRHHVCVCDDHGRALPELSLGEITIESPCVTPGYFRDLQRSSERLREERLLTGDIGFFYQGELYFYARRDDVIVCGGRNITPDDIEMLVEELPFVRNGASALLGVENETSGCVDLLMIVEARSNIEGDAFADFRHRIQSMVYNNAGLIIKRIVFCERGSVEKTSSGKKRRAVIRNRLLNNQLISVEECYERYRAV